MHIFQPALDEMEREGRHFFGPSLFIDYLATNGLRDAKTAQYISVDSLERLSPDLRRANVMVFRLGSRQGQVGTHFGLARCPAGWSDFFLFDEDLLQRAAPQAFLPAVSARRLFAFQLLPRLTEGSLVNLAIASGLLQHALGLGDDAEHVVPATGQSTFTFDFLPRTDAVAAWSHVQGQVEIDALFVGRRAGRETLFLVEAKSGPPSSTLAKHKLAYPLAALRQVVPPYIDIVPVYMKTWQKRDGQHFLVAECQVPSAIPIVVSQLEVAKVEHLVLHGLRESMPPE